MELLKEGFSTAWVLFSMTCFNCRVSCSREEQKDLNCTRKLDEGFMTHHLWPAPEEGDLVVGMGIGGRRSDHRLAR